jgi:hypothetical protein
MYNDSIKFYLINAFDFELRNNVDLEIKKLTALIDQASQQQLKRLEDLNVIKEFLVMRIGELKI